MKTLLPIAMSDIHAHLETRHVEELFGQGHSLTKWRDLTLPGQFACYETVEVVGPSGRVGGAVVVGPPRRQTQVEISLGNALALGIDPPCANPAAWGARPAPRWSGPPDRSSWPAG
jgi:putative phosphotransacetylase